MKMEPGSGMLQSEFRPLLFGCHRGLSVVQSVGHGKSCVHCGRWALSSNLTVGIEQFASHFSATCSVDLGMELHLSRVTVLEREFC